MTVCVAVAWLKALVGLRFEYSYIYQRHDVRKCDEIMNSRRNELSVFIRITFSTYSSTAVPMHEMMAILG